MGKRLPRYNIRTYNGRCCTEISHPLHIPEFPDIKLFLYYSGGWGHGRWQVVEYYSGKAISSVRRSQSDAIVSTTREIRSNRDNIETLTSSALNAYGLANH